MADLYDAARDGDCPAMRAVLVGGANVDERFGVKATDGTAVRTTALTLAVAMNHEEAVDLLFEHNADPSLAGSTGVTPLHCAAQKDHLSMLEKLLQRKNVDMNAVDRNGDTAFHHACWKGHADCAEALANAGCDMTLVSISGETGLQLAQREGRRATVAMLLRRIVDEREPAPKQTQAACEEELGSPEILVYEAADRGDCPTMRELLDGGTPVDKMIDTKYTDGTPLRSTALIQAVYKNQQDAFELLLEYDADPNRASSTGYTPVMCAEIGRAHV
jgi:ankyrin repeat protein